MPASENRIRAAWLLLRLFTAFVLMYGTADNVFSPARMLEFRDFLAQNGFPQPLLAARVSAHAQFAAGALIAVGLFTRFAGAMMAINFLVALVMVHRNLPFGSNVSPLAMLVNSVCLAMAGAPHYSIDALASRWLRTR